MPELEDMDSTPSGDETRKVAPAKKAASKRPKKKAASKPAAPPASEPDQAPRSGAGKGLDIDGWGKALEGDASTGSSVSGDPEAAEKQRGADKAARAAEAAATGRRLRGSDLAPDAATIAEETATRRFWIGTLPNCPRGVVHLGGFAFQEYVDPEVQTGKSGAQPRRAHKLGQLVDLTDRQIEGIVGHLQRKFWRGSDLVALHPKADVEELKKRRRYRPVALKAGDVPVASTVYMVEQSHRDEELPASVYDTGLTW